MRMRQAIDLLCTCALCAPCLAIFSENDNINVNLFGLAYTAVLCVAVKLYNRKQKQTAR